MWTKVEFARQPKPTSAMASYPLSHSGEDLLSKLHARKYQFRLAMM